MFSIVLFNVPALALPVSLAVTMKGTNSSKGKSSPTQTVADPLLSLVKNDSDENASLGSITQSTWMFSMKMIILMKLMSTEDVKCVASQLVLYSFQGGYRDGKL